jgi:outer membrane receptor protein involved in Fe transport
MELVTGASGRRWHLDSEGTFYYDMAGPINFWDIGFYAMASIPLGEKLKLTASSRYDKNENFEGTFTPRFAVNYSLGERKQHNFRASFQTGFMNPDNGQQFQHGDLGFTTLLGGGKLLVDSYKKNITSPISTTITGNDIYNNSYTLNSVLAFLGSGNSEELEILDIDLIQPEKVQSWEIGYKGILADKLYIDLCYYHNRYTNFIGSINVFTPLTGSVHDGSAVDDITNGRTETFTLVMNSKDEITSQGVEFGFNYAFGKGYSIGGNYTYSKLHELDEESAFIPSYNTPEHRINLSLSNRRLIKKLGFRLNFRWWNSFYWEHDMWFGTVDSYGTLDVQFNYKLPSIHSVLKIGGSNILSQEYQVGIGNGKIGGLYYISLTFDKLLF